MYDALFSVGGEGGLFEDVVECAGVSDFFEGEDGIGFVFCKERYRAYADDAIEE